MTPTKSAPSGMSFEMKTILWGCGAVLFVALIAFFNPNEHSTLTESPAQQYVLPKEFFLKPAAERGAGGEIYISGTTNLPEGMKMWVILGQKKAQEDAYVKGGKFRSGALYPNVPVPVAGRQHLEIFAMFNGAWQNDDVISFVGEGGKNLHGNLFKPTDPDVSDSGKKLQAAFNIALPPVPLETNAISIVKHAILTVPEHGRSATDIEKNISLFETPGTGVTRGKGWSATPAGPNSYNVAYDFVDGTNGPKQAIWSVNIATRQVKYVNYAAKLFSWTPKD